MTVACDSSIVAEMNIISVDIGLGRSSWGGKTLKASATEAC